MSLTRYYTLSLSGTKQQMSIDTFYISNVPDAVSPKIRIGSQVDDSRYNMRIKSSYAHNVPLIGGITVSSGSAPSITLPAGMQFASVGTPINLSVSATMHYRIDVNGTLEECLDLLNQFEFSEVIQQITEQVIS